MAVLSCRIPLKWRLIQILAQIQDEMKKDEAINYYPESAVSGAMNAFIKVPQRCPILMKNDKLYYRCESYLSMPKLQ